MIKLTKTTAAAGLTALTLTMGAFAVSATPAAAAGLNVAPALAASTDAVDGKVAKVHHRWRHRRWRRGHGVAAAAGIIGFAAGAAIAAQAARDCGYVTVKKRRWNRFGERVIIKKRVYVCD